MNNEWKMVPATMTLDMSVAFAETWFSKVRCIDDAEMQDAYAAMLAAAPTPPASAQDEPITVALEPDPRGVSVGVWQGPRCVYTGAHPLPAPAAGDAEVLAALKQAHMALIGFMPQHRNDIIVNAIVAAREAIDAAEAAQRKGGA